MWAKYISSEVNWTYSLYPKEESMKQKKISIY